MPPGSSIVNICSVAAVAGHAAAAYTSSKWALRGLTRTASLELGTTRGIRVNAVMPGLVDTPLMASAPPAFTDAALAEIPLGRVGAGRHRADDRVPGLRRRGVLQRRRDRHRRRAHRARLAQGHRRRDPAAAHEDRDAPAGRRPSSTAMRRTCCRSPCSQLIELGLGARSRSARRRRAGGPSRSPRRTCCCPTSRRRSATS